MKQSIGMLVLIGMVVVGMIAVVPVFAQTADQPTKQTIFDYKDELKLTDKQEGEIRQILADLNREVQIAGAKLTILKYELEDLINQDDKLDQLKKNLQEEATLRANVRFADLVATRKINKVLSPDQLAKWRKVQDASRTSQ